MSLGRLLLLYSSLGIILWISSDEFVTLGSPKCIRDTDDHGTRVFEYIHAVRFQNRDQNERVGAFELLGCLRNGLKQPVALVELVTDEESDDLGVRT